MAMQPWRLDGVEPRSQDDRKPSRCGRANSSPISWNPAKSTALEKLGEDGPGVTSPTPGCARSWRPVAQPP